MKKILYVLSFLTLILFCMVFYLFKIPFIPSTINIVNQSVKTPYFRITLPEKMNTARGEKEKDVDAQVYTFSSSANDSGLFQQMNIKVSDERVNHDNWMTRYDLQKVTRALIQNPSLEEAEIIKSIREQIPQYVMVKGISYSLLAVTMRNTQFIFLHTVRYEKSYIFELISRDEDITRREGNMNAMLSSIEGLQYVETPSESTKIVMLTVLVALCLIIIAISVIIRVKSFGENFRTPTSIFEEVQATTRESMDVKRNPVLSKYRIDPNSYVARKKVNILSYTFIVVGIVGLFVGIMVKYNLVSKISTILGLHRIYPYMIFFWLALGLVFLMIVVCQRRAYSASPLLAISSSIGISCLIAGFLWTPMKVLGFDPNGLILVLVIAFVVPLYKVIDFFVLEYLRKTYIGKIFKLEAPIIIPESYVLIKKNHLGLALLGGLRVIVVGDDLELPVGSLVKVTDIEKEFNYFIIERV